MSENYAHIGEDDQYLGECLLRDDATRIARTWEPT